MNIRPGGTYLVMSGPYSVRHIEGSSLLTRTQSDPWAPLRPIPLSVIVCRESKECICTKGNMIKEKKTMKPLSRIHPDYLQVAIEQGVLLWGWFSLGFWVFKVLGMYRNVFWFKKRTPPGSTIDHAQHSPTTTLLYCLSNLKKKVR